ncbi:histidine kinase [Myroides marinus]|uniref:Histidine kinase n=1 Tax=Myroides marinus TaxID=703342 RepID=A0A161S270_9FLAO|nr:tetratricopeptide repeat-containing sensor histidine kinase [Myroides marinus]KZE78359.1 histidine kinase [Myroides marinus]
MKYYKSISHLSNYFLGIFYLLFLNSCLQKEDNFSNIKIDTGKVALGDSLQLKADSLNALNQLDNAFTAYLKSNTYYINQHKEESITYNNLRIATIYLTIGDPNSAQEIISKELPSISTKENSFKVYIYNTLAICYAELKDYALAIEYFNLSLELASSSEEKIILLNNIASNYIHLNQGEKAIAILQGLISSNTIEDNIIEKARILNNLGKALFKQNNTQGLNELEESLTIRLNNVNQDDIFRSYITLAEYYVLNKNYTSAYDYALKSYDISKNFKNKNDKLLALEYLAKSNQKQSSEYLKSYIELSKEISTENQKAKNQFAKIRYDFQLHEQENTKLKLDLQHSELVSARNKNALYIALIILITGGFVISFIYRKIRQRHRLDKIQQAYLTETNIAKKIHDELANDVFNTLTYTQNFNLEATEAKNHLVSDLESIYKKARNISLQHSSIATDGTFASHLTNLFNEYSTANCKIILSGLDKFDFTLLDKNQKITIYRVIQELLVNMKKHSMATIVVFKFTDDKKSFNIFYSDNGVGIIQENIKSKNGLLNVENRIKNIGGTFTFDSTNQLGVKYNIQLPKKNYV